MKKSLWIFSAIYMIILTISVINAQLVVEDIGNPMNEEMGEDVLGDKEENGETPKISINITTQSVDENCGDCVTGIEIIANDDDTDADLEISIDWENSKFIKNGRTLDLQEYENFTECVEFDFQDSTTRAEKRAKLKFRESNPDVTEGQSPDFETFDTLDLQIKATDKNQIDSITPNSVTANVQIYINDLNDNVPYFTNAPYDKLKVTEKSDEGTLIGYITATDDDVGTELTYSLERKEGTPDGLVKLENGILTTTDKEINADGDDENDLIKTLHYTVTITDEDPAHIATAEVIITVDDINDQIPVFIDKPPEGESLEDIKILEQSDSGTVVAQFKAIDGDRDEINNKITYSFRSEMDSNLRRYFNIDKDSALITVTEEKLDRDDGVPPPPITISIEARDSGNRFDTLSFTVVVTDINNKAPELGTKGPFEISENNEINSDIELIANDRDDPNTDNSKVSFELIGDPEGTDNLCDDTKKIKFILTNENSNERKVTLKPDVDLEGFIGTYKMHIKMTDKGETPLSTIAEVQVNITKYNFKPPIITEPKDGGTYLLKLEQTPNSPLKPHLNEPINLNAKDDQCDKFTTFTYSIEDENGIFKINTNYITVQHTEYKSNTRYQATITASIIDESQVTSSSVTVTFVFVDTNISPVFENQNVEANDFKENEKGVTFSFPEAHYLAGDIANELGLEIYYIIISVNGDTQPRFFSIPNSVEPVLQLDEEVDFEETPTFIVVIQASSQETGVINPDDQAKLTITVNIQDVNDNEPVFEKNPYYTILKYDDKIDDTLITIKAIDPDVSDKIEYFVTKQPTDSNYPTFKIDSTGALKLEKDATSAATNYATVEITAKDCVQKDGVVCDFVHETKTNVEIYVVTEDKHIQEQIYDEIIY